MNSQELPDPRVVYGFAAADAPGIAAGDLFIGGRQYTIDGQSVGLARGVAGLPEYARVARAEQRAKELRAQLLDDLDMRGGIPYQASHIGVDWEEAASETVTVAVEGFEQFFGHWMTLKAGGPDGNIKFEDHDYTLQELRRKHQPLDDRYKKVMPVLCGVDNPAQQDWWSLFKTVQTLATLRRHAIMEPFARGVLQDQVELVQRLIDGAHHGTAQLMLDVFNYFSPGWVEGERLVRLPAPPSYR